MKTDKNGQKVDPVFRRGTDLLEPLKNMKTDRKSTCFQEGYQMFETYEISCHILRHETTSYCEALPCCVSSENNIEASESYD